MPRNCTACSKPLEGAIATVTFTGFTRSPLNDTTFQCHARCLRLVIPDRDVPLPRRVSDPVAEPLQ